MDRIVREGEAVRPATLVRRDRHCVSRDLRRFHGAGVPAAIYHYTSVAALVPIATADELWLSDATFLNDRAEIGHGVAVAAARLRAAQDDEADDRVRAMLAETARLLASEPRPPVYVCCFSGEQDDLGQWRGYGRGAPVPSNFASGS